MRPLGTAQPKPTRGTAKKARRTKRAGRTKEFLNAVWEANDGTCAECSRRIVRTADIEAANAGHVHHIRPRSVAPELRFEPSNGVCLCRSCHLAHHHQKF